MIHELDFDLVAAARKTSRRGGARPGSGRKPILRDRVGLTVQFDGEVYYELREVADRRGVSLGSLIRRAVATYLRRGKGR